jgi:hypothetical protein
MPCLETYGWNYKKINLIIPKIGKVNMSDINKPIKSFYSV